VNIARCAIVRQLYIYRIRCIHDRQYHVAIDTSHLLFALYRDPDAEQNHHDKQKYKWHNFLTLKIAKLIPSVTISSWRFDPETILHRLSILASPVLVAVLRRRCDRSTAVDTERRFIHLSTTPLFASTGCIGSNQSTAVRGPGAALSRDKRVIKYWYECCRGAC
jgi:hypothetical protein